MPEMNFFTEEPKTHWSGHLIAVMFYPNDELKRKELFTVLLAKNYLAKIECRSIPQNVLDLKPKPCGCYKWEKWSQELLEIVATLVDAPSYENIFDKTAQNGGMIAGEVLYWSAITENSGLDASIAKAEYMLSKNPPTTITGKELRCSVRTIRAAWKKFMPVAHLHSALRSYSGLYVEGPSPFERPDLLIQLSEFFRHVGENIYPGNQGNSILDANKTWKPPKSFPIIKMDIDLPQLNKSGQDVVANYLKKFHCPK
jgi:hypothetical protein